MEQTNSQSHRTSYLLAGFVISALVVFFIGIFLFPLFWKIDPLQSEISLVFICTIFLATLSASVASYFWSVGGVSMKNIRLLAVPNASPVWFMYVIHPQLGKDLFFVIFGIVVVIFCAFLGSWFGRRFFFE